MEMETESRTQKKKKNMQIAYACDNVMPPKISMNFSNFIASIHNVRNRIFNWAHTTIWRVFMIRLISRRNFE